MTEEELEQFTKILIGDLEGRRTDELYATRIEFYNKGLEAAAEWVDHISMPELAAAIRALKVPTDAP
jgi:hypothetical protein